MPTAWNNPAKITKIAVCTPYNSDWKPEWVDRTYIPLKCTPTNWCTKIIFLSKVQSLPVARDMLVNQALQNECDYLFFIDTDMIFEYPQDPNAALSILYQCINKNSEDKDGKIISALYRAKQKTGYSYAMWTRVNEKGFTPVSQWTGNWLNVSVTGLGCTLIDTKIFREIPRPWFRWELKDEISEDFYFFELVKKYGYSTHVFTDVKLSHLGDMKLKIDGSITTQDM